MHQEIQYRHGFYLLFRKALQMNPYRRYYSESHSRGEATLQWALICTVSGKCRWVPTFLCVHEQYAFWWAGRKPRLVSFHKPIGKTFWYDFDAESVANHESKSTICTGSGLYNIVRITCLARFGRSLKISTFTQPHETEKLPDMRLVFDRVDRGRS